MKVKVTWSCSTLCDPMDSIVSPWNSPGQNTGVGSLSLLQVIFPTQGLNPGLPPCRQILYQLSHKGSPLATWCGKKKKKAEGSECFKNEEHLLKVTFCTNLEFATGRRKRQPTPVFMPGKSHGPRSLVGYNPWGRKELDTTERLLCVCVC